MLSLSQRDSGWEAVWFFSPGLQVGMFFFYVSIEGWGVTRFVRAPPVSPLQFCPGAAQSCSSALPGAVVLRFISMKSHPRAAGFNYLIGVVPRESHLWITVISGRLLQGKVGKKIPLNHHISVVAMDVFWQHKLGFWRGQMLSWVDGVWQVW